MSARKLALFVAPLSLLAFASSAVAGTDAADLEVSATVTNSCTIDPGTLAFGTYDTVSGVAVDGSGTLAVACTVDAVATVTLGQGANADAASTDAAPLRRMVAGLDFLAYTLYSDAGRTTEWGNTAGTGAGYTATSSAPVNLTVYGRITSAQDVAAGSYADTVVATITF